MTQGTNEGDTGMRRNWHWIAALGLSLALLVPTAALAQTSPSSTVIGNTLLRLGVSNDASLAKTGTGLQFVPTLADGLANGCACSDWNLSLGDTPLVQSVESFTFTTFDASLDGARPGRRRDATARAARFPPCVWRRQHV